jgi:GntR family transcriptional regulator/MocR family aminotransferase
LPETLAESTYRKLLACDKSDSRALHAQLTANIVLSIESLALLPGQHLPSSRELARILGVSRRTVVRSYEDLLSQGFLKSIERLMLQEKATVRRAISNCPIMPGA